MTRTLTTAARSWTSDQKVTLETEANRLYFRGKDMTDRQIIVFLNDHIASKLFWKIEDDHYELLMYETYGCRCDDT